jgi:O-acetyl-ADP-ribose deacetylase (regulator of RNase III)
MTIVNTVNTIGVMGAGLALEYRIRYPEMFEKYRRLCESGLFDVGQLWIYKSTSKWVLNFPTKKNWRLPSKIEYIERGLNKFWLTYAEKGIQSVAFPLLGTDKGGLGKELVHELMICHLSKCEIDIEIYSGQVTVRDPDLLLFLQKLKDFEASENMSRKLPISMIKKINDYVDSNNVVTFSDLLKLKGLSIEGLIKLKSELLDNLPDINQD